MPSPFRFRARALCTGIYDVSAAIAREPRVTNLSLLRLPLIFTDSERISMSSVFIPPVRSPVCGGVKHFEDRPITASREVVPSMSSRASLTSSILRSSGGSSHAAERKARAQDSRSPFPPSGESRRTA